MKKWVFNGIEKPSVSSVKKWADKTIMSIKNTEHGWGEGGHLIPQYAQEVRGEVAKLAVVVFLNKAYDESANDPKDQVEPEATDVVLNLQYFLPYCDQALRQAARLIIAWIIVCENEHDVWRVRRYLGNMSVMKDRLHIGTVITDQANQIDSAVVSRVTYDPEHIGSLLPLLCVGSNEAINPDNSRSGEDDDLSTAVLSGVTSVFSAYQQGEKNMSMKRYEQRWSFLCAGYSAIDSIHEYYCKSAIRKIDDTDRRLDQKRAELQELSHHQGVDQDVIQRKKEDVFKTEQTLSKHKQELKKCEERYQRLWAYIHGGADDNSRLDRLPLITQVIWLSTLSAMIEQGDIYDLESNTIYKERIELSLWDAITYGEGIIQLLENCEIHSQHHCGYLTIYFHRVGLKYISKVKEAADRRVKLYHRYRNHKNDSFEKMHESVYLEFNVTDMGRDSDGMAQGIEVKAGKTLDTLFQGDNLEQDILKVVHHYGMPLFYRTVCQKDGRFICCSPYDKDQTVKLCGVSAERLPKREIVSGNQSFTNYQILLPLTTHFQTKTESGKCEELLDSSFLKKNTMLSEYKTKILNSDSFGINENGTATTNNKINDVNQVNNVLRSFIGNVKDGCIYVLNLKELHYYGLEICLKGLFLFIAEKTKNNSKTTSLLLRLLFKDEYALCEAVRRFSIFYDRAGTSNLIGNTQIALCDSNSNESVRLVLAGNNISACYLTAKQYMHYNIDISSGLLLSQVEYLAVQQFEDKRKTVSIQKKYVNNELFAHPVFPFDLVPSEIGKDGKKRSNFDLKITGLLNQNIQSEGYGCKIENAHIRLGSKIHIQDFYDAELLFQSVANISRFAYLIVERILKYREEERKYNNNYCLIGYENYSSILIEEIKRLLVTLDPKKNTCKHLQYIKIEGEQETIIDMEGGDPSALSSALRDSNPLFIVILPVGTTMSTVYKIKNLFYRKMKIELNSDNSKIFSLIVVGETKGKTEKNESEELFRKYWQESEEREGRNALVLQPETYDTNKSEEDANNMTEVEYLFMLRTNWYSPDQCDLCDAGIKSILSDNGRWQKRFPLGRVDKTSTIPKLIYPLNSSKKNHTIEFTIKDRKENDDRLQAMKGCIEYGHIQRGGNHYQFYINYEQYYQKIRTKCIKWMNDIQKGIDGNAYNIIISPLQFDNALFVKDAIDNLFQHSLRFIYISLHQTYREEMRSRFSYIASELKEFYQGSKSLRCNIYYIDYSLVSGQSLIRAETLIRMLLNDAGFSECGFLLKKVILLTNRSTFDTAASFVEKPTEDFLAFSTLCIPSYNTVSNRCPACEMVEKYQTIAKCSATNELYWHYQDLEAKHRLKTLDAHRRDLNALHRCKPKYFQSFYSGVFHHLDSDTKERTFDHQDIDKILHGKNGDYEQKKLTLQYVLEKADSNKRAMLERRYKELLDGRNWRRLICTHQAILENAPDEQAVWKVIVKGIRDVPGNYDVADIRFEQREWLISYIKVFSREYPAKLAPIRSAILSWMELMFVELLNQTGEEHRWWKEILADTYRKEDVQLVVGLLRVETADSAERLQLYQLFLTLGKRLCDLQSNMLLQFEILQRAESFLVKLRNGSTSNLPSGIMGLPDDDEMRADYLFLLKWVTMSSDGEAKAFLLQNMCKEIEAEASNKTTNNTIFINNSFAEVIRQENTRVLYSGIKRLNETFNTEEYNWKALYNHVETKLDRIGNCTPKVSLDQFLSKCSAQNPLHDLSKFLRNDLCSGKCDSMKAFAQLEELLTSLLGFYKIMEKLAPKGERELNKDYNHIYSALCFFLRKMGGYQNCCLVHRSNDDLSIIAQNSNNPEQNLANTIRSIFTKKVWKSLEDGHLDNTIWVPDDSDKVGFSAMVLALRIRRSSDVSYQQKVFAVLFDEPRKNEIQQENKLFDSKRYMLFMRQQLQAVLERDLYALHHFKFSREDVVCVHPEEKKLCILHLTDLHISMKNKDKILGLLCDLKSELKKYGPELVVVTGDVVQGNGSASDLEENYDCAKTILSEIARVLWTEKNLVSDEEELRVDWQKRIIIIPGNHDYSSMNELVASSTLRATTLGVPSYRNGSPMSKYAYYIQFVQDFLGIDSRQLIRDNLNLVVKYQIGGMILRFIALNSIAEVGPLRNNKVQLDDSFISSLSKYGDENAPDDINICLSHHTRCYKPDYFEDRYYDSGITKEVLAVAKKILTYCADGQRELRKCPDLAEDTKTRYRDWIEQTVKDSPTAFEKLKGECNKTALSSDVRYVIEHWTELTNERCAQIISDYELNDRMAENDCQAYRKRMEQVNSAYPITVSLGGHRHLEGRTDNLKKAASISAIKGKYACAEGGKFYTLNDTKLRFGRLLISKERQPAGRTVEYQFYPSGVQEVELIE